MVVLFNGRPLALEDVIDDAPAILEAWFPGVQAGPAVADVVFGEVNPGGKLPVSFPRRARPGADLLQPRAHGASLQPGCEMELPLRGLLPRDRSTVLRHVSSQDVQPQRGNVKGVACPASCIEHRAAEYAPSRARCTTAGCGSPMSHGAGPSRYDASHGGPRAARDWSVIAVRRNPRRVRRRSGGRQLPAGVAGSCRCSRWGSAR